MSEAGGGGRAAAAPGRRKKKKNLPFAPRLGGCEKKNSGEKPVAHTGAFEFGFRPRVRDSTEGKNSRLRFLSISGFENSRGNSKPPFERRLGGDEGSRRALSFMFLCECGSGMGGPGGGRAGYATDVRRGNRARAGGKCGVARFVASRTSRPVAAAAMASNAASPRRSGCASGRRVVLEVLQGLQRELLLRAPRARRGHGGLARGQALEVLPRVRLLDQRSERLRGRGGWRQDRRSVVRVRHAHNEIR